MRAPRASCLQPAQREVERMHTVLLAESRSRTAMNGAISRAKLEIQLLRNLHLVTGRGELAELLRTHQSLLGEISLAQFAKSHGHQIMKVAISIDRSGLFQFWQGEFGPVLARVGLAQGSMRLK